MLDARSRDFAEVGVRRGTCDGILEVYVDVQGCRHVWLDRSMPCDSERARVTSSGSDGDPEWRDFTQVHICMYIYIYISIYICINIYIYI